MELPQIHDNPSPTEQVLSTLEQHLPYSLPTFRRIQFMSRAGGRTPHTHILTTFHPSQSPPPSFLIAFLDFSRGPEVEMWLYSSLEHPSIPTSAPTCSAQILGLFTHTHALETAYAARRETPGIVLVGTLHERILQILEEQDMVRTKTEEHFKFIFRTEDLPLPRPLPEGLAWGVVRDEDVELVLKRTAIPYKAASMKRLPSAAVTLENGTPIAWVFLGADGSLKTLHCENEYRGRGLAKAVSLRLLHERTSDFGQDGYSHADVAVTNLQSQAVCKGLKGTILWRVYFAWIDISRIHG